MHFDEFFFPFLWTSLVFELFLEREIDRHILPSNLFYLSFSFPNNLTAYYYKNRYRKLVSYARILGAFSSTTFPVFFFFLFIISTDLQILSRKQLLALSVLLCYQYYSPTIFTRLLIRTRSHKALYRGTLENLNNLYLSWYNGINNIFILII